MYLLLENETCHNLVYLSWSIFVKDVKLYIWINLRKLLKPIKSLRM